MEHSILWSALVLGSIGWLIAMLLPPARGAVPQEKAVPRPLLLTALALPVTGFLLTLPSAPPFAAGHGWGTGFLLGGFGSLLSFAAIRRCRSAQDHPLAPVLTLTAPWFLSLPLIAFTELRMHDLLLDALMGIAIGWIAECILVNPISDAHGRYMTLGAGFCATLCAAVGLAAYHGSGGFEHARWIAAILGLATLVPFALLLTSLPAGVYARIALRIPLASLVTRLAGRLVDGDEAARWAARATQVLVSGILILAGAKLLSLKIVAQPHLFTTTGIGFTTGLLSWWLVASERTDSRFSSSASEPSIPSGSVVPNSPLAVLVILCGIMLAWQLLAGIGVACALTGMWLAAGIALWSRPDADSSLTAIPRLLLFGSVILLYRFCDTRFTEDLRGTSLADNFDLFGVVAGTLLPGAAERIGAKLGSRGSLWQVTGVAATTVFLLAVPTLGLLFWGSKCTTGLLFGLALSIILTPDYSPPAAHSSRITPALALLAAAAIAQWTHLAMPLASLSKAHKIQVMEWSAIGIVVLMLLVDYGGRFASRKRGESNAAGVVQR